ncbi:MAG: S41 family peptidase [Bryobacteraceae bacterium]
MKRIFAIAVFLCLAPGAFAQLSQSQKVSDFTQLAALYAKNYAPYEWKRDVIGFDMLNLKPWLDQIQKSTDDLSFYDICVRYVASLQDSHDEFTLPSDFEAYLHLGVDIYDGKVLIDGIDRTYLPSKTYPFRVGDELVSVDGKSLQDWITALAPYAVNGSANPTSRQRLAANIAVDRVQSWYPGAVPSGDNATIVIRRQDGTMETDMIPWDKLGTPLVTDGLVPSPKTTADRQRAALANRSRASQKLAHRGIYAEPDPEAPEDTPTNPWGIWQGPPAGPEAAVVPEYMQPLAELQVMQAVDGGSVSPFGATFPVFNPPAGFKLRLGAARTDQFLSGTYQAGADTIGLIRIPTMSPSNTTMALSQFQTEINFFQQNTNGLVIDVMGNGGGSLCYVESLERSLIPVPFRSIAYEIRATRFWVNAFSFSLTVAKLNNADQWVIDLYTAYLQEIQQALAENRGRTGNVPICGTGFESIPSAMDAKGNNIAYTKPILVLTDNFTLSAAEAFTMILQDAQRATVFGTRTDGGGGNPGSYNATTYSEGSTRVSRTFVTRAHPVQTPGFPASTYLENTGVYPDIVLDYMTQDNLLNGGKSFVSAFSAAISDLIAKSQ